MNIPEEILFRFEDLEIWQRVADLAFDLSKIADSIGQQRPYRFAQQLPAAALSISNNIAKRSGSSSVNEFRHFLNIGQRPACECANMLVAFHGQRLIERQAIHRLLIELNEVRRLITALSRTLG